MTIPPQTRLGRYEIRSSLGTGGMGEVYLARDTTLERSVALKVLPAEFAADEKRMLRFEQEAKAASGLNHPNIITIHEIGRIESVHFIATEYIQGTTLRQRMAQASLSLAELLEVAMQTASALAAAHEAGVVHRDIKPDNIMLRQDGYVKVLDFGLAKLVERTGEADQATEAPTRVFHYTTPGMVMGTVDYMSPEQAAGLPNIDERTDIWSLGVVIYEMVARRLPFGFEGATPTEILSLIIREEAPELKDHAPLAPDELNRIVMKALENKRDDRYQSAKEMLVDLRRLKKQLEREAEQERSTSSRAASPPINTGQVVTCAVESVRSTSSAEYLVTGIKRHKRATLAVLILTVVCLTAGLWFYLQFRSEAGAIDSIAVLPFENQNQDPETEYLSDGLTESIINSLTQVPRLRVIARSSVFRYKGKETDPQAAARDLGVRSVMTGRVVQRGDNVTVSAELMDVRDNKQLWGEHYDRKLSDLLSLQREIAAEISSNLRLRLSGVEQTRLSKNYTENAKAYQLYMKGRFHWNKRTGEAISKAVEYFNQAIAEDPSYALAYAGLADSYALLIRYAGLPRDVLFPKARAAALKAVELDPNLAEAHTSLASLYDFDWDFANAERGYQRAIQLNPNYATARQWYAEMLSVLQRHPEALAEIRRAQETDPLSLIINTSVGALHAQAGHYDESLEQLRKTIEMDRNFPRAWRELTYTYEAKEMFDEAISAFQAAEALSGRESAESAERRAAIVRDAYRKSGARGYWQGRVEILEERLRQGKYVNPFELAQCHAHLRDKEKAFDWLEKSYAEHGDIVSLKISPEFAFLRSDPRYLNLVRRVGLPQ